MKKRAIILLLTIIFASCVSPKKARQQAPNIGINDKKGYVAVGIGNGIRITLVDNTNKIFYLDPTYSIFTLTVPASYFIYHLPEGEYTLTDTETRVNIPGTWGWEDYSLEFNFDNSVPIRIEQGTITYIGEFTIDYSESEFSDEELTPNYLYDVRLGWEKVYRIWGNAMMKHEFRGYLD
ncbi:MAG: hypothetical protein JXR63_02305 [Spirochaetales bacterium]|nr:hypothetical protein [Spirochaetales bacterium]